MRQGGRFAGMLAMALIGLVACRMAPARGGQVGGEAGRPGEFRALDRWIGEWDLVVSVKPGPWAKEGSKSTFVSKASWDLNGRFLRCDAKGQTVAGDGTKVDDSFLWMCTYDVERKEYRSWVFWSAVGGQWGSTPVASGTWDEAAKTMKLKSEEGGVTSSGTTRWIDADHHEFVTTMRDANGQVLMEQVGKAKRRDG